MTRAPLGHDVSADDPTVNRLEEEGSRADGQGGRLRSQRDALGNLGLSAGQRPSRQEVIADAESHLFLNEAAGAAMVGGIQIRQVRDGSGRTQPGPGPGRLRPP